MDYRWIVQVGERIRHHCLLSQAPRPLTYRDFLDREPGLTQGLDEYHLCREALLPIADICVSRQEPILSVLLGSNLTMKPEDWLRIVYEEMGETVPEGADYRKYIFKKRREAADYWIPRPFSVTHPS